LVEMGSLQEQFMRGAIEQAKIALLAGEVPVGCVFVDEKGNIVGKGYNKTNKGCNGTYHAEMMALDDMILRQNLTPSFVGTCDLYVTCEPCIMCAAALARLGIKKVYFGCYNERFGGNGSILSVHLDDRIKSQTCYPVQANLLREEAVALFQQFYLGENRRAPEGKRKRKGSK